MNVMSYVKEDWLIRPWWMNLIFYFCIYMTLIYMPFDLFYKPVEADEEVFLKEENQGQAEEEEEGIAASSYSTDRGRTKS